MIALEGRLPQESDPSQVTLWAQVLTGMERHPDGTMQVVSLDERRERSRRLHKLGGFSEAGR